MKHIFLIVILLILILFASKNIHPVEFYYYTPKLESKHLVLPLIIIIWASFLLGLIINWVSGFLEMFRLKTKLRTQSKKIELLQQEISSLKQKEAENKEEN